MMNILYNLKLFSAKFSTLNFAYAFTGVEKVTPTTEIVFDDQGMGQHLPHEDHRELRPSTSFGSRLFKTEARRRSTVMRNHRKVKYRLYSLHLVSF